MGDEVNTFYNTKLTKTMFYMVMFKDNGCFYKMNTRNNREGKKKSNCNKHELDYWLEIIEVKFHLQIQ